MSGREVLLQISELHLNFYTKEGVVRALDGVDLTVFKGETFGLVGESGCGKSATANSIMKLIPSPPGEVGSGRIMFFPSEGSAEVKDGREMARVRDAEGERGLRGEATDASHAGRPTIDMPLSRAGFDILQSSDEEMRAVRGNAISMIFQEPTTSLNPVLTSGDQISDGIPPPRAIRARGLRP